MRQWGKAADFHQSSPFAPIPSPADPLPLPSPPLCRPSLAGFDVTASLADQRCLPAEAARAGPSFPGEATSEGSSPQPLSDAGFRFRAGSLRPLPRSAWPEEQR